MINEIYQNRVDPGLIAQWAKEKNCYYPLDPDFNTVHTLLREYYMTDEQKAHPNGYSFAGQVFMFYSFQDLGHAFGWNTIKRQLDRELTSNSKYKLEQHRSIMGTLKLEDPSTSKLSNWKVRDLAGWTNTSLESFAKSLGIEMCSKHLLDQLKEKMEDALIYETKTFLDYGLDDVLVLREIFSQFLKLVNSILKDTLLLPPRLLFTESTIPLTTGALVAEVFERYIFHYARGASQKLYYDFKKKCDPSSLPEKDLGSNSPFLLALWALSFLIKSHSKREEYIGVYRDLFSTKTVDEFFKKIFNTLKHYQNGRLHLHLMVCLIAQPQFKT